MAGKKRFHKEMGDYLKERKRDRTEIKFKFKSSNGDKKERTSPYEPGVVDFKPEGFGIIDRITEFFMGTPEEPVKEELTPEEKEKVKQLAENKKKETPKKDTVDEEDFGDLDVPKPSFMDKMVAFFGFGEPEYKEIDEFNPEDYDIEKTQKDLEKQYKDDVKELVLIAHSWLEQLSTRKKREFKQSEDFERYRELLAKLKLLKEKKSMEKELKDVDKKKK